MKRIIGIGLLLCCFCVIRAQEVLILPYDATELSESQRAMNPERLAYPTEMKETILKEVNFECTPQEVELGPFSVSATTKVMFSPGNLQFNAMKGNHQRADEETTEKGTWRFAEHQLDFVGDKEKGIVYENGTKCSNTQINATYNGWIDLFGWGTSGWESGANAYKPYATNTNASDYNPGGYNNTDLTGAYANADWGVYNAIQNGSTIDPPGTWRTLTSDEWVYLFHGRKNAEKLFGLGTVNNIPGTIILPDDWDTPSGVTFTPSAEKGLVWNGSYYYEEGGGTHYTDNTYTAEQWPVMESGGAVFLPAAGYRDFTDVINVGSLGLYWSTTHKGTSRAYYLSFNLSSLRPQNYDSRSNGFSVRLVKDVK